MRYDLSVIVPVVHEQASINECIRQIKKQTYTAGVQIIVVDGDPSGSTLKEIRDNDIIGITAPMGRARQMNAGAMRADGKILVFLHCDTQLPDGGFQDMVQVMEKPSVKAGAFDLAIHKKGFAFRIIETIASLRSRITRLPYGDQVIFMDRAFFFTIGQYHPIPIMEDVELMQRTKKHKGQIFILKKTVLTSARRWEKEGLVYCTLRNWAIMMLYLLGASPHRLARLYQNHH